MWRLRESFIRARESYMSYQVNAKSVAICDTEPIAIEGIRMLLGQCEDLRLAAAETSLLGGMEIVRQYTPTIMILDKGFGIYAVMDCLQRLRGLGSGVATIVWGVNLNETEALRMMQVGALGWCARRLLWRRYWTACARWARGEPSWRRACCMSPSARRAANART